VECRAFKIKVPEELLLLDLTIPSSLRICIRLWPPFVFPRRRWGTRAAEYVIRCLKSDASV